MMKIFSTAIVGALLAGTALGASAQEGPAVPMPGEGRVIELNAEQKQGETAALERRYNATILAGVQSAHKRDAARLESVLRQLLTEGTLGEKAEYVGSAGSTYSLPNRLAATAPTARFNPAVDGTIRCRPTGCRRSHPEQTCSDRLVCNLVCAGAVGGVAGATGGVAGGVGGAIGGAECSRVCQTIPECRTINICDEQVWEGPGCF